MAKEKREKKIQVVHIVPVTPHQCGMYETAREIAEYERKLGINAFLFDPRSTEEEIENSKKSDACESDGQIEKAATYNEEGVGVPKVPDWSEDREVCTVPKSVLAKSDILVSHSGINPEIRKLNIPYIHLAHGRPRSSFLIEKAGGSPIYSLYKELSKDELLKGVVTLWPDYVDYLQILFGDKKVHGFSPLVNLNEWQTTGPNKYNFGGLGGKINVVCSDIWRLDKDPYHVVNAFVLFAKKHEGAKLHLYAVRHERAWGTLLACLKERGILGEVKPLVHNLSEIYRTADMLITPHKIATRTVREALACGLQVVAGDGNRYTKYAADEENLKEYAAMMDCAITDWQTDKKKRIVENRGMAERGFDPIKTAKSFVNLFKEVLNNVG